MLKLYQLLPERRLVRFIQNLLLTNRSMVLFTNNGQQSRRRLLKSGVPQGPILSPMLFNIYLHDMLTTVSKKYAYADDLAIRTLLLGVGIKWKIYSSQIWQHYPSISITGGSISVNTKLIVQLFILAIEMPTANSRSNSMANCFLLNPTQNIWG